MKALVQEHIAGCGIACVAYAAGVKYSEALNLLPKEYASNRGYFCRELVHALAALGLSYSHRKVNSKTSRYINREGTIVFIEPSQKYPKGHYLVRVKNGWMNPWINFPVITPAKAGFARKLPGKVQWVIFRAAK